MKIDKSLLSGSTALLLLKLLEEEDMYGYQMIETLSARSKSIFELKAGTLYPILHSLEQKGMVDAYEKTESSRNRKYYSLTQKGKKHLREKEAEWREYSRAVNHVLGGALNAQCI
jgi:DNA-binding PadR family transcriptional regulator